MKKGEMGVGTLIIFIALLLVAAVAAGVLIQTAGSLQEQSLATGDQARSQISTHAQTIEVSAVDGQDSMLNYFSQLMKLAPGSDEIKLDQVILTMNTVDKTSTLRYRGTDGICQRNVTSGYVTRQQEVIEQELNSTWYTFTEDIDYDGVFSDMVRIGLDNASIELNLTSFTGNYNYTIASIAAASTTPVTFDVGPERINSAEISYGRIRINGTTNQNGSLLARMVTILPYKEGEGYFAVDYLQQGTNFIEGNLQRGDVIKLCFESPLDILEDAEVRINFIPKIGTPTLTQFVTPDVISTERVYLYP